MAWYNASWTYRVKITVDSTLVPGDLTDFPVYVNLANLPAGFFSNVKSDGGDIRVTKADGTTEVPREVVTISTGGSTGELHFKASGTLSSSVDTDFYIYYGNSGASEPATSDTYGAENVWNSSFQGVWHLQEDPSGTAPQMIESTSNARSGTSVGSMTTADSVSVKIQNGLDFDGTNDYLTVSSFGNSASSNLTISAWFKPDSVSVNQYIADESNTTSYGGGLTFRVTNTAKLRFWQQDANTTLVDSTTSLSAGTTYFGVGTFDGTNTKIYLNGSLDNTRAVGSLATRNAGNYQIGHSSILGGFFNGFIDELRISTVDRGANWISTEYSNQNSPATFYTVGTQETDSGGAAEQPAIFFGIIF